MTQESNLHFLLSRMTLSFTTEPPWKLMDLIGGTNGCQCRRSKRLGFDLCWEEEEMATHSSILTWRIPWTEEPGGYSPRGHKESDMTEVAQHACTRPLIRD